MKVEHVVDDLKQVAGRLGFQVRMEKGSFRGGRCTVSGEEVIVINRQHIPEIQLSVLAESLRGSEIDNTYIKPAVRRALEDAWKRSDTADIDVTEEADA